MNTPEIEQILHQAPKPAPPAGLKERLVQKVILATASPQQPGSSLTSDSSGWFRRWWPALAPASISLACAVVFTVQQMEIRDLKQSLEALPGGASDSAEKAATQSAENTAPAASDPATLEQQEIARLRENARRLAGEVAQLERLRDDNNKLRVQLATAQGSLTPEEAEALAQARERALAIACVNNMKQLGLAARIWATDNNDMTPPDILSMTNEINTPKILVCPADTGRQSASDFATYTSANCSYEYLAAAAPQADQEPNRVLFRCPVHGSITLCDGSVQLGVGKKHPELLVQREGKLYYEQIQATNPVPGTQPAGDEAAPSKP